MQKTYIEITIFKKSGMNRIKKLKPIAKIWD